MNKLLLKIKIDINNYDPNNYDERKVLESNYFSSYKGHFVIRTNMKRSGSYIICKRSIKKCL